MLDQIADALEPAGTKVIEFVIKYKWQILIAVILVFIGLLLTLG